MAEQPIIIKKIKKGGHAHHGGAWKLAYADFVTAMMAFFLLMWLLGSTTDADRKGIAQYFSDPYKISLMGGMDVGDRTQLEPGGGKDLKSQEHGQVDEKDDLKHLEQLESEIKALINSEAKLSEFKDQIKLEITQEGLRVLITDKENHPMFKLASSATEPQTQTILRALAPVINELPNKISINGHTDARPFPNNKAAYSNWELSSDRANAARRELVIGGLNDEKILRITGLSSSIPLNSEDPLDPINRRISIVIMNKKTENEIVQGMVHSTEDKPAEPAPAEPSAGHTESAAPAHESHESAEPKPEAEHNEHH
ncbi:flagellar motor protein MotB [Methylocucumis oryzae]|uniref:flagellar motor protein MotB n=1 Tax=Methylocucumis oryzae TaxID=1632867 RepID=UPI0009E2644C|nr:flagellar motor protein MotB [Methylocucumis oryzae]